MRHNGWRLEEFQHYWGNATFDDGGTAEASRFLLRLYLERRDPTYNPALDRAIQFVMDSQSPIGAWPRRFPLKSEFSHHGKPDYTSYLTFNDDVAHDVQQDEIERLLPSAAIGGLTVAGNLDLVPFLLQVIFEGEGNAGLVFDNQDAGHHHSPVVAQHAVPLPCGDRGSEGEGWVVDLFVCANP